MGSDVLFRAIVGDVAVMPHVRQNRYTARDKRARDHKRASEYNSQQNALALLFRSIANQTKVKPPLDGPLSISFTASYTDRRKRDITNILKALEDALVRSGVIEDDSTKHIAQIRNCAVHHGRKRAGFAVELRRAAAYHGDAR